MGGEWAAKIIEEWFQTKRLGSGVVRSSYQLPRKLVQRVIRFIGKARTADDADRVAAVSVDDGIELLSDMANGVVPCRRDQLAVLLVANQRRANACFVVHEGVAKAALDAEKLSVNSIDIAIARHDAH
jgi:hypothetical protein